MKQKIDLKAVLFFWILIVIISAYHHLQSEVINIISWDVYGYYLYLPAIFKYFDIHQFAFALDHLENYRVSGSLYQLMSVEGAEKAPIYTIGMAVIYAPFYFIADLIARVSSYPADGLSPPYQWMIIVGSWCYSLLGLYFFMKSLVLLGFRRMVIWWTLAVLVLGTNYFHYIVFENGMPHTYLFSLYVVLIYLTIRWHREQRPIHAIFMAVCIALLALARPSEIISLLLPLFYGVYSIKSVKEKITLVLNKKKQLLLFTLVGVLIVSIQMFFWKFNIDRWFFNGYAEHKFEFLNPHFYEGFFSYRKGWLLYTPLMILAFLGLPRMLKIWKEFRVSILLFLGLNFWIVLSWPIWWYASSFGMRALIQSYAVLIFPVAFLIDWALQKKYWKFILPGIICLGIFLNQFQDWQYRNKILLQDEMTETFYWKSFLKTDWNKELRKFVDIDEDYPFVDKGQRSILGVINYMDSVAIDSNNPQLGKLIRKKRPYSDAITIRISEENLNRFKGQWIEASAEVFTIGDQQHAHQTAKFVLSTSGPNRKPKWNGIRFQRFVQQNQLEKIKFSYQVPEDLQVGDKIECLIWNAGPDQVFVRSFKVSSYDSLD